MGVTNRNEVHYKKPDQIGSSTESLYIPQSSSLSSLASAVSADNIGIRFSPRRQKRHNRLPVEGPVNSPRHHAGRRRLRRYTAVAELAALIEEDVEIEGIPHNSPFTTILENPELEKVWNNFMQKDEWEQEQLTIFKKSETLRIKNVPSYSNISLNIRMTFKMMRSLYELESAEDEILQFLTNTPENAFVQYNKNSYQRLLIHGVAQYYHLKSTSFDAEDGKRTIKVENPNNYRDFSDKRLTTVIENNRKYRREI